LTRASIRINAKRMDCRVRPGNDKAFALKRGLLRTVLGRSRGSPADAPVNCALRLPFC
jgi:hypothetical protein